MQLPPATAAMILCTVPHVIINNITELMLCRSKITANCQQKYNCNKPLANTLFCAFCDGTLRFFPSVANIKPNTVITEKLRAALLEVLRSFLTLHYLPVSSEQKICINVTCFFLKPSNVTDEGRCLQASQKHAQLHRAQRGRTQHQTSAWSSYLLSQHLKSLKRHKVHFSSALNNTCSLTT